MPILHPPPGYLLPGVEELEEEWDDLIIDDEVEEMENWNVEIKDSDILNLLTNDFSTSKEYDSIIHGLADNKVIPRHRIPEFHSDIKVLLDSFVDRGIVRVRQHGKSKKYLLTR